MKKFLGSVAIIVCVVGVVVYLLPYVKNLGKVKVDDITYFRYNYTIGYELNSNVSYLITCKDICTATIKLKGVPEEDAVVKDLDSEFMEQLKRILMNYKVEKWNGFYKVNKHVLDGDSFALEVKMANNKKIEAYGYMKWPDHYGEVREEIDALFMSLLPKD